MKKLLLILLVSIICKSVVAQDIIYVKPSMIGRPVTPVAPGRLSKYKKDSVGIRTGGKARLMSKVINADIDDILDNIVIYKPSWNPDGPYYVAPIDYIDSIRFSSGVVQKYLIEKMKKRPLPAHQVKERQEYANLATNLVSGGGGMFLHRIRFLDGGNDPDFTPFVKAYVSYEKIFLKDRIGIEVSPFVAFNKKAYGGMVHAKYYPKNYGQFRVGLGPVYTAYIRNKKTNYRDNTNSIYITREHQTLMSVLGFGASLQMNLNRRMFVNYNASIGGVTGYTKEKERTPADWERLDSQSGMGQLEMRLGLGYRF